MNIVYSTSEYYFKPTLVSLYSLLKNSSFNHNIFLLSSDVSDKNKKTFNNLVTEMGSVPLILEIENILEDKAVEMSLPKMRNNYSTYARLFLSEILDVDEVLLIDSDTLIVGDIQEITHDITKDGVMFAARDFVISNKHSCHEDKNLSDKTYFNMGVLYTNLANWRNKNLTNLVKDSFDINHKLKIADQTIVNKYLSKYITEISVKYNWYTYFQYNFDYKFYKSQHNETNFIQEEQLNNSKDNPVIIHYIGTWFERPWFRFNINQNNDLYLSYWKELFKISELYESPSMSLNMIYDYFSIFIYKVFGLKAYYNYRYILIQKLKRML